MGVISNLSPVVMSSQNHGQSIPSPDQGDANPSGTTPSENKPPLEPMAESPAQQDGELKDPDQQTAESGPVSPSGDLESMGDVTQVKADEGSEHPLPPSPGESVEERVSKLERRHEETFAEAEHSQPLSHEKSLEERVSKLERWQEAMDEQLKQQQQQLEEKDQKLREKDDQAMRRIAEFDNFRRRTEREKDERKLQYTCAALQEILPVLDSFERARKGLSLEKLETLDAQEIHHHYQGVYKQLVTALKRLNVSHIKVEGQMFDPALHEAVMREPSQEYGEDIVMEELQRGYHLEGEVLRHAMVKVSMGPGPGDRQPVDQI